MEGLRREAKKLPPDRSAAASRFRGLSSLGRQTLLGAGMNEVVHLSTSEVDHIIML